MEDWNKRKLTNSDITFIQRILSAIEKLKDGVIAYSYLDGNAPMTWTWWIVSVSDYDLVFSSKFKKISQAWHESARKRSIKLIFVCGWKPTEEKLAKLAEEDNLILNIS